MFIKGEVSISRCAIVAPRAKKTLRTRNGSKNILSYAPKHVKKIRSSKSKREHSKWDSNPQPRDNSSN